MRELSSEILFEHPRLTVSRITVERESGAVIERVVVDPGSAVAILAIRGDGDQREVAMISQPREVIGRDQYLELPAGKIDLGEIPIETAKRELAEETGLEAANWIEMGDVQPSVGYSSERVYLYAASGLRADRSGARPDQDEEITLRWMRLSELDLTRIDDSKSIALIARYLQLHG